MAKQFGTIEPEARTSRGDSAYALSQLERVTNVARKSVRIARAAASIAMAREYLWQPPAKASLLKDAKVVGEEFPLERGTLRDGSGAGPGERNSRSTTASAGTGGRRATALADAGTRSHRQIPELSQAMRSLARIERSVELGNTGRAISDRRNYAKPTSVSESITTGRTPESLEARRGSFAGTGIPANVRIARSIRGVTPPANVSQREFAQPLGNMHVSNDDGGRGGITINASPTVVINAAGGAVQNDVIGALRAHREELFDELKRESARRERAQF